MDLSKYIVGGKLKIKVIPFCEEQGEPRIDKIF